MTILDDLRLETRAIHYKRIEDPHGPITTFDVSTANVPAKYNGFTYESAWATNLRIHTMWYANEAQFSMRRDLAEKEILHFLYKPMLHRLSELKSRAADRDWQEVIRIACEIEKELVG